MVELGLAEIVVWLVTVAMYVLVPVAILVLLLRLLGYRRSGRGPG